jgi:MYXO-CTERM domain-containing protein
MKASFYLLAAVLTAFVSSAHAATIVYNFDATSTTTKNVNGVVSGADGAIVTAGAFGFSGDANVSASTDNAYLIASSSASTQAGALSSTHYLTFTITPAEGQTLQLNSFSLNFGATNYATNAADFTNNLIIQTSIGGLGTGGTVLTATNGTKVTGVTTQNIPSYVAASADTTGITFSTPLTVQIRFYDDSSSGTAFNRVDDITLNVVSVPEPSAAVLAVTGLAFAAGVRRRRA